MKFFLLFLTWLLIAYACDKEPEVKPQVKEVEKFPYEGISSKVACGSSYQYKIKLTKGIEVFKDSFIYTERLVIDENIEFMFDCKRTDLSEYYNCSPNLPIDGNKIQVVLTKLKLTK